MHLDTSFLIDIQRERGRRERGSCHRFLESFPSVSMRVSVVAMMEYLEGFSDSLLAVSLRFFDAFECVPIDAHTAIRASRIRRELRLAGSLLPDADVLIAACAMEHNEPLVTDNADHFRRVPGLQLFSYR